MQTVTTLPTTPGTDSVSLTPITVTVPTACALLGVGKTTIFDLLARGELDGAKIGTRRLIYYRSIQTLAERSRAT